MRIFSGIHTKIFYLGIFAQLLYHGFRSRFLPPPVASHIVIVFTNVKIEQNGPHAFDRTSHFRMTSVFISELTGHINIYDYLRCLLLQEINNSL